MGLGEARAAWREAHRLVGQGESPIGRRPASADSFATIVEEWLQRDQGKNRTAQEVRRAIDRNVLPVWRDRPIATIKRRDVIELIDAVADRGSPIMARRLYAYLHRLFRWCVGRDIVEVNPATDLPLPGAETKRDRVLTDAELIKVLKACNTIGWPFGPVVRLLVFTGARKEEINSLRWSEIDGACIRLSGDRTKSATPHAIPLAPEVAAILKGLPHMAGAGFVFTIGGRVPLGGWSKAKDRLDEISGVREWRLHDLRRTVATGMQRLGFNLQVIEACLGHVSGSRAGIVGVYQRHSFDDEKRQALEAWARHVEQIASGKPAKVVQLRPRRR